MPDRPQQRAKWRTVAAGSVWSAVAAGSAAAAVTALLLFPSGDPGPPAGFGQVPDGGRGTGTAASASARAATPPGQKPVPSTGPTGQNSTTRAQGAPPVRVVISRADLSAAVVPVGVRDDGRAEVPTDPAQAGWYRFGPAPGDAHGSAVLIGHVDSRTGELGELAALYDIRAGDRVDVQRGDDTTIAYEIVARRIVKKDRMPADVFRRDGEPVLTLITCAPPYDPDRGGYQSNLIVTAVRSAS
ncbi:MULTISPECIES: class F sortase [Streptomyces]|uniref:class F sortase n=1 Tax=Streptomyces TaxID=1883 RepID=UPI0007C5B32E|nr:MULTISPECIES: class F sortase [Streptomyces]RPK85035.1 Sortase family protein [Streptomyces sp. ADI98-10]